MKQMMEYVMEHKPILEKFCAEKGISIEKIMNSPMSYNHEVMFVLWPDKNKGREGLLDETPMKTLLTITKDSEKILRFELVDDAVNYLK